MPWFKIDDSFHHHPKVMSTSPAAIGLWVIAGTWCAGNSRCGHIPRAEALLFGSEQQIAELATVGLWQETDGGYSMPATEFPNPLWSVERDDYRKKLPERIRAAVYERDGHRCVSCASPNDLTLDHIWPWSLGGPDTIDNLQVLCQSCNSSKGARI